MSKKQEETYRRLLNEKKAELLTILSRREGIAIHERMADLMDEVVVANDRELAIDALNREAILLGEVQLALDNIDDDTYGICAGCEERIPRRRLEAVPWARLCLRCQEEADQVRTAPSVTSVPVLIRRVA